MKKNYVSTVGELCKTCYTCVRGCPAKAIRISHGRAEIIEERCINCAICSLMCSRGAKRVLSETESVINLLKSGRKLCAIVAPSFPVELYDIDVLRFAGMLKKAGFSYVCEVAFGADMVSLKYREIVSKNTSKTYISTACPAVVSYVEKYHPSLVPNLAPVVSPVIAMARIVKKFYGDDTEVVFIGPCVAKKEEIERYPDEILLSITYKELREVMDKLGITPSNSVNSYFDPPYPGKGVLYPVGRGLLDASDFKDDILSGKFMSATGPENFTEVLKNLENGDIKYSFIDILCCDGCIMGPGITHEISKYRREEILRNYARERYFNMKITEWEDFVTKSLTLDFSRSFKTLPAKEIQPSKDQIKTVLESMGKINPEDELNCGACGYATCVEHAAAIIKGLAESEMCLPYTIDQLKRTALELHDSYSQLANTKKALMQSEKLAGMGQVAASIAHELNNPLGVILLYAKLIEEDIDHNSEIYNDVKTISEQADRCKKIVSNLLNFARKNKPLFKKTDVYSLFENYLKVFSTPDITVNLKKEGNTTAEIDPDQLTHVITNMITNAVEAMPEGGKIDILVREEGKNISFSIADSGTGIKKENLEKIFEPFFTTKQIGKGTGLGLAVSYGIIKAHKGVIKVESNADPAKGPTGTKFTVILPKNLNAEPLKNQS